MTPIEEPNTFTQPPPGFYRGPAQRGGTLPSLVEQDIDHLISLSRAKMNNLLRSRKDSGLLKHVLIQNLSRSYGEWAPEHERDDGYDEVMDNGNTEEMWFDSVLKGLNDDDDEPMFEAQYYYPATPEDDLDLVMSSRPSLPPDMPSMDDSDLHLASGANLRDYDFYSDDEDDGMAPPPLMDLDEHDHPAYIDLTQRDLHRRFVPISSHKMRFLRQQQRERECDWYYE